MDILVDIPGMLESSYDVQNQGIISLEVELQIQKLHRWRLKWQLENANAARDSGASIVQDPLQIPNLCEFLQRPIVFDSLSNALEILYYNVALVILLELKNTTQDPPRQHAPITRMSLANICQSSDKSDNEPLLFPGEIKFECQPAIEAMRIIWFIMNQRFIDFSNGQYIPPAPFGIIYWALLREPELQHQAGASIFMLPPFNDGANVFQGFKSLFRNQGETIV